MNRLNKINYIISTDLDSTLLDHHTYSFAKAKPALDLCTKNNIPIIFNTSKTRIESLELQRQLKINHPFIIENGSALIIPNAYFRQMPSDCQQIDGYTIKYFGKPRIEILQKLQHINQQQTFNYSGFSNWTAAELAEKTGLSTAMAKQANEREYSEPILWQDSEEKFADFSLKIKSHGLKLLQGGRFLHVLGETNKAIPINWIRELYKQNYNQDFTLIALGDSDNDIAMLEAADIAVVIKSPVNKRIQINANNSVIYSQEYGPLGWNESILTLINE